jgi:hypothetical protein
MKNITAIYKSQTKGLLVSGKGKKKKKDRRKERR